MYKFFATLMFLFSTQAFSDGELKNYIYVDVKNGHETFYVDSALVDSENLYKELPKKIKVAGPDVEISVLISEDVTQKSILNLR